MIGSCSHDPLCGAGAAQFVSVRPSEAVAGIDVSMVRGRTARVAGRILDHAGAPTMGGSVRLRPRQGSSIVGVAVGARLSSDGRFEFPNVPPGDYVIQADRGRSNPWTEGAFLEALRARAAAFTLSDHARSSVNLRLSSR